MAAWSAPNNLFHRGGVYYDAKACAWWGTLAVHAAPEFPVFAAWDITCLHPLALYFFIVHPDFSRLEELADSPSPRQGHARNNIFSRIPAYESMP